MGFKSTQTIEERFWSKVKKTESCWIWLAAKGSCGHGSFMLFEGDKKKMKRATHVAWKLSGKGDVPKGYCLCHKCDNPPCINPDHLFLGTQADNLYDMTLKGRRRMPDQRGYKNANAKLTAADHKYIRHLYFAERHSQQSIAALFGVWQTQVSKVVRRKTWA